MTGNGSSGRQPFVKIPISHGVEVVAWENSVEKDGKKFNILGWQLTRGYKDKKTDEWVNQKFNIPNVNVLYMTTGVLPQIMEAQRNFYLEQREAQKPETTMDDDKLAKFKEWEASQKAKEETVS